MDYIDLIQWPAMVATVVAAWLVASQHKRKRELGKGVLVHETDMHAVFQNMPWG